MMSYRLTERDLQVPVLLKDYSLLTTSNIQKLLYPNLSKAQSRLKMLQKSGLVKRFAYPLLSCNGGRCEFVYHLPNKSKVILKTVVHTVKLNDIRIAFELASQKSEGINLIDFITEYKTEVIDGTFRRIIEDKSEEPIIPGRSKRFIPDAVVCFENSATKNRGLFFLELDLASERLFSSNPDRYTVLGKLLLYKDYLVTKGFKKYSGMFDWEFKGFRVLVVLNNQNRIQRIRKKLTQEGVRKFIWFSEFQEISEGAVFDKIWLKPDIGDDNKYSILDR